jgi:hypothetical protein
LCVSIADTLSYLVDVMWPEILLFVPIAIATNTAFPVPFDPLYVWFVYKQQSTAAILFAFTGAGCAGLACLLDLKLASAVAQKRFERKDPTLLFYAVLFLCALFPLPFSVMRTTLLKWKPPAALYASTVMAGRLPRYLLLIYLGHTFQVPSAISIAVVVPLILFVLWSFLRKRFGGDILTDNFRSDRAGNSESEKWAEVATRSESSNVQAR